MHITQERGLINDLDSLPFPAREEIDMKNYLIPPGYIRSYILNKVGTIYSSRGCPGKCTFCCSYASYKGKYRQRSINNVIKEIDFLIKKYNIEGLYFNDETFTYDKKWVIEFCNRIKSYNLPWGLATRVTLVDYNLLKIMKDSGCMQIDYGVESGSDRILKLLKKGTSRKIIENAFSLTHKAGIRTLATIMVGSPSETKKDIDLTIDLLRKIKPNFTLSTFFVPLPGTEVYNELVKDKKINPDFYKNMDYHIVIADTPLINVSAMSDAELIKSKACIDQATFLRNYISLITLHNLSFMIKVVYYSFLSPQLLFKNLFIFIKTQRSDKLIGFLLNNYQTFYLKNKN